MLTRPWGPVSGLEPGPHWALGVGGGTDGSAARTAVAPPAATSTNAAAAAARNLGRTGWTSPRERPVPARPVSRRRVSGLCCRHSTRFGPLHLEPSGARDVGLPSDPARGE